MLGHQRNVFLRSSLHLPLSFCRYPALDGGFFVLLPDMISNQTLFYLMQGRPLISSLMLFSLKSLQKIPAPLNDLSDVPEHFPVFRSKLLQRVNDVPVVIEAAPSNYKQDSSPETLDLFIPLHIVPA